MRIQKEFEYSQPLIYNFYVPNENHLTMHKFYFKDIGTRLQGLLVYSIVLQTFHWSLDQIN